MRIEVFASAVSMELRKILSYRFDFWVGVLAYILITSTANFSLWKAIFVAQEKQVLAGFNLYDMAFYSILAACVIRTSINMRGSASNDIYTGDINKYLLYPVSFFMFKFAENFAQAIVGVFQLLVILFLITAFFPIGANSQVNVVSIALGIAASFNATVLYFLMSIAFDLISFWADGVWSFQVLLRLSTMFFGGAMIPIAMMPEGVQSLLAYTPFPYIVSFPVRCFQGIVSNTELHQALLICPFWILALLLLGKFIYGRGLKTYSGVGM